jgi:cellulose synthase/poly-beta-1,6-N-acetylglucosamine synthase-like glycosyltransferase
MTSWIKTAYQRRFFLPTSTPPFISSPTYEDEPRKNIIIIPNAQGEASVTQGEASTDILVSDEVTIQDDVIFEQDAEQDAEQDTEQKTPLTQEENISPLITFIVPTINRVTLSRTLASIQQQTVKHWKAIVIFDGCEENEIVTDERIHYMSIPKTGSKHKKRNTAGHVRNHGMRLVDTPWIGFVDDDDAITPKYVEHLVKELEMTPTADLILFRMVDNDQIIPSAACSEIKQSQIGISFAMKTDLVKEGFLFVQSSVEDYTIVKKIEASNKKIVLSPHICYLVRDSECEEESVTMHYVIN